MTPTTLAGARIFDGDAFLPDGTSVTVLDDTIAALGEATGPVTYLDGGYLVPGFLDLQVNGGGGHLISGATTLADLRVVLDTHARFGVTNLLPTLITDTPSATDAVLAVGAEAARQRLPGFLGLHLEGPHLSLARKGAHDPALIRPMEEADLVRLERARAILPHLIVTVATENCRPEQIARLVRAGVTVSLGHTDAGHEAARAAVEAGASVVTHLFNAMSQMGNREPGLVGTALADGRLSAGFIGDGIHIHRASLELALRAKAGPGRMFLVSDSMSQAGTDVTKFTLNGRRILRREGALRLEDGTLAGADLTMDAGLRYLAGQTSLSLAQSLALATRNPAEAIGATGLGRIRRGGVADLVHLGADLTIRQVWRRGTALLSVP